jgi:hypoxanthine-guanine phosphoribosyltransferase
MNDKDVLLVHDLVDYELALHNISHLSKKDVANEISEYMQFHIIVLACIGLFVLLGMILAWSL